MDCVFHRASRSTQMHMQPVFRVEGLKSQGPRFKGYQRNRTYKARVVGGEVAEGFFNRGLCLPSGTAMTDRDLDRVIETILNCKRQSLAPVTFPEATPVKYASLSFGIARGPE
jgi:dTDP-4-amino-4,6-dideoxygalactose transaminase